MPHLSVTLAIGRRDPEPFEALLFELGAASVTLLDAGDDPVLEPAPGATPLWPTIEMRALFAQDADRDRLGAALSLFAPDIEAPGSRSSRIAPGSANGSSISSRCVSAGGSGSVPAVRPSMRPMRCASSSIRVWRLAPARMPPPRCA
jgi:hypothetical protein